MSQTTVILIILLLLLFGGIGGPRLNFGAGAYGGLGLVLLILVILLAMGRL